jgi:hypothetical protein
MRISTGVQAILRFRFSNLKGSNTVVMDGKDLRITPLRWAQMSWYAGVGKIMETLQILYTFLY